MAAIPSVGIVGCGVMGADHARVLQRIGGVRIAACCDTDETKAAALARETGAGWHTTDALRLIRDPSVGAVYICTRNDTHAQLAVATAEAGKPMMIEKPLALSVAECRRVVEAVNRAGVVCMTAFKFRYYPSVSRARAFVPDPFLGIGQMLDVRWPDTFWGSDPAMGGGNVLSQGCHAVDLLCHLMGSEPVRVSAGGGTFHHLAGAPMDTIAAVIHFASGGVASLVVGDSGESPVVSKLSVQIADGKRNAHLYNRLKSASLSDGETISSHEDERELGMELENRMFLESLRGGLAPPTGALDGLRATAVLEAAVESVRSGSPCAIIL